MLDRIWTEVSRRTSGDPPRQSAWARLPAVRLHAERLEERLLMAADDPVTESALVDTLTVSIESKQSSIVADLATKRAATAASSAATTDPGWDQFGSKA